MKLSYYEQLKHPKWQKMRLEVLEAAGWKCSSCACTDKTLHVHHKQYIKGRAAWDYDMSNFEALCETCHADAHNSKEIINEILAALPSEMWMSAASLLAGWAHGYIGSDLMSKVYDAQAEEAGELAWAVGDIDIFDVIKLRCHVVDVIASGERLFPQDGQKAEGDTNGES